MTKSPATSNVLQHLNKVPEVTVFFWLIKVLATTVGETAADFLNTGLGYGLTKTSEVMSILFLLVLIVQFRTKRYVAPVYWIVVVLVSIVGTLITDNLSDNFGVPLATTTTVFAVSLAIIFAIWYSLEKTFSIHTIYTRRRESFYWLAVLFTFALGTAAGDFLSEKLDLGYGKAALIFGGAIVVVAIAHFGFKLNAVAAFWFAYILTRPFGASVGDLLSQSKSHGGLGFGPTNTSRFFTALIILLVAYLGITRRDSTESRVAS